MIVGVRRFIISVIVTLLILMTACSTPPAIIEDSTSKNVLFVGDSITAGVFEDYQWWTYVDDLFFESEVIAELGWTSVNAAEAVRAEPVYTDVVFIALGANDFWTEGADTIKSITELAQYGKQCVVIAPWQRTGFQFIQLLVSNPVNTYEQRVAATLIAANLAGCSFVNWGEIDSARWSVDGLHPSNEGARVLAQHVLDRMVIK